MANKVRIPFFTDQNVPDSVGRFIVDEGYELTRLRDVMVTNSPDPVIAIACSRSGHVLVTQDRDFRDIAKRLNVTQRQYRQSLHRIFLSCKAVNAVSRFQDALSLIEHEWALVNKERPLIVEIRENKIITQR